MTSGDAAYYRKQYFLARDRAEAAEAARREWVKAEDVIVIARHWRHQERIGAPTIGARLVFIAVDEYEATL